MTSPLIPCPFTYGDAPWGGGVMPTIIAARDPSNATDIGYPPGYLWLSDLTQGGSGGLFVNAGYSNGAPNWAAVGSSSSTGTTGASPIVVNSRTGTATFSSVSIAAAATQTFTITNSAITASSMVDVSMYGATTGAALTIQSVTPTAGSLAVVITNGTGATTSTANITLVFQVLN